MINEHQLAELTHREWQILLHIADDLTNAEIVTETILQPRTIINMRNRIGDKLHLKGRNTLGQFARAHQQELRHWFGIFYPER